MLLRAPLAFGILTSDCGGGRWLHQHLRYGLPKGGRCPPGQRPSKDAATAGCTWAIQKRLKTIHQAGNVAMCFKGQRKKDLLYKYYSCKLQAFVFDLGNKYILCVGQEALIVVIDISICKSFLLSLCDAFSKCLGRFW